MKRYKEPTKISDEKVEKMALLYPDHSTKDVARECGVSERKVYMYAYVLQWKKTVDFLKKHRKGFLTFEEKMEFCDLFPYNSDKWLAKEFDISFGKVRRLRDEFDLKKSKEYLHKVRFGAIMHRSGDAHKRKIGFFRWMDSIAVGKSGIVQFESKKQLKAVSNVLTEYNKKYGRPNMKVIKGSYDYKRLTLTITCHETTNKA